jgi:hypothetical protein
MVSLSFAMIVGISFRVCNAGFSPFQGHYGSFGAKIRLIGPQTKQGNIHSW